MTVTPRSYMKRLGAAVLAWLLDLCDPTPLFLIELDYGGSSCVAPDTLIVQCNTLADAADFARTEFEANGADTVLVNIYECGEVLASGEVEHDLVSEFTLYSDEYVSWAGDGYEDDDDLADFYDDDDLCDGCGKIDCPDCTYAGELND